MGNNLIENALQFAAVKHTGQVRKGTNIPYITHPYGVALILQQEKQAEEVIAAGLLHDTLEDTNTSEDELLSLFGEDVLKLVKAASEPDKSLSWEERKKHTITDLQFRSNDEITIIAADKLHNLRSIQREIDESGENVWTRFNRGKREQSWYYMGIVNVLKEKKREVPLIKKLEKEVFKLFVGKEKLVLQDISLLFECAYGIHETQKAELRERGILEFAEEVSANGEAIYRSGDYETIKPLIEFLEEKGVSFESNSDGPFKILAFLTELKHRLAWSDDLLYKHFLKNQSKL